MELQTAKRLVSKGTTNAQLLEAFDDDYNRGEFIILSEDRDNFIQAAGEGDGPYMLEYREGKEVYRSIDTVKKSDVLKAFQKYLKGDISWKSDSSWKIVPKGFVIGKELLIGAAVVLVYLIFGVFLPRYSQIAKENPENSVITNAQLALNFFNTGTNKPNIQQNEENSHNSAAIVPGTYSFDETKDGMFASKTMTDTVHSTLSIVVADDLSFQGSYSKQGYTKSTLNPEIVTISEKFTFKDTFAQEPTTAVHFKYLQKIDSTTADPRHRESNTEGNSTITYVDGHIEFTKDNIYNGKVTSSETYILTRKE